MRLVVSHDDVEVLASEGHAGEAALSLDKVGAAIPIGKEVLIDGHRGVNLGETLGDKARIGIDSKLSIIE